MEVEQKGNYSVVLIDRLSSICKQSAFRWFLTCTCDLCKHAAATWDNSMSLQTECPQLASSDADHICSFLDTTLARSAEGDSRVRSEEPPKMCE